MGLMTHYLQEELEQKLRQICDRVDDQLEDRYGEVYPLHPNRPRRGGTANKAYDGLFNITATFTPGYGSRQGRGYLVNINMVTLDHIDADFRETIFQEAVRLIDRQLQVVFPDRKLRILRDGNVLKIVGDFSLGKAY